MKEYFTQKWDDLKGWFFNKVIVRLFGKQITSSVLIVNEDGTLPYTITDEHVILTLNGGGKVQISKERFRHYSEYSITPARPNLKGGTISPYTGAPRFVDIDSIEAHNEFKNRQALRPISVVIQDNSFYDKKALKKQLVKAEEKDGHFINSPKERKLMKKKLGTRDITKEAREKYEAEKAEELLKSETVKTNKIPDAITKLMKGANNSDEYNPEDAVHTNRW